MDHITWDANGYIINEQRDFLISGEFHYFRVSREDWSRRLDLLKAAGANLVATYIPWILHEPMEGDFRLGDQPYRDLEAFLDLCQDKQLSVLCRPGPYQYSEMRYCGLPTWLCENYPEILARDKYGKHLTYYSVSYLHPLFLEKVHHWFTFICPVISRHTTANGGPVAFVQIDNELMGIHEWHGGWDYSPQGMGIGSEDGRYVQFLLKKYEDLNILNDAYATQYTSLAEVDPTRPPNDPAGTLRMDKDYRDFYFESIAEYAACLADWVRAFGIHCPLLHNSGAGTMNAYFLETRQKLGKQDFLLGVDSYYTFHMDSGANNPTPQSLSQVLIAQETLRLMGYPPTIFELQAGNCMDWPPVGPRDLAAWYYGHLAFGMKGMNYYVFTGGYNPEGIGEDGDAYDYCAPIGSNGDIRPSYGILKDLGAFLKSHSWLAKAERVCDVYLGLDWIQARSRSDDPELGGCSTAKAWEFLRKGLLITGLSAALSPRLVDLSDDSLITMTDKPLMVASGESMSKAIQERLINYIEAGGKLLLAPEIPCLDEEYRPCTLLEDYLGAGSERYNADTPDVQGFGLKNISLDELWRATRIPTSAKVLLREQDAAIAWHMPTTSGGHILYLGATWRYQKNSQRQMLLQILSILGLSPALECNNPYVWTVMRAHNDQRMLFLMNYFTSPQTARVAIRCADGNVGTATQYQLEPMTVQCIEFPQSI